MRDHVVPPVLCQSEDFDHGIAKEYHVWDSLDIRQMRHMRRPFGDRWGAEKDRKRYFMQRRPNLYFEHFVSLYRPGITLTADVTPSCSGLKPKRLKLIREGFLARGRGSWHVALTSRSRSSSGTRFAGSRVPFA